LKKLVGLRSSGYLANARYRQRGSETRFVSDDWKLQLPGSASVSGEDARMLSLLGSRRFAPLFWCQFFAAFNDNLLKTALVFLILFQANGSATLVTLASGIFIAPFFFLSGLGGELADRFDKARVARSVKFVEIFVALVSVVGFRMQSLPVLFGALGAFGVLAALFGPVKYGILPDHLRHEDLPGGNALIEGATFIAILTGTIAGGMVARGGGSTSVFALCVIGVAVAAWAAATFIPAAPAAAPDLRISPNVLVSSLAMVRHLGIDRRLVWGALVVSWFWTVGIVVLALLPPLIKRTIGGDEATVTVYLALFSIAVGIGSALAAWLAGGRIRLSVTVAGAILIGVFALDLAWAIAGLAPAAGLSGPGDVFSSARGLRAAFDLSGLALAGGLFVVPAFAAVQAWAGADHRARTIAGVNVLNAAFMTAATLLLAAAQHLGATLPILFAGLGIAALLVAAAIWATMPKPGLR
jgi:acyl-[acyl-carrier-protein]-phospholipid O-acyltransferase/long-chain-fatty-acid--[acyl-carrier-protein] ligase